MGNGIMENSMERENISRQMAVLEKASGLKENVSNGLMKNEKLEINII